MLLARVLLVLACASEASADCKTKATEAARFFATMEHEPSMLNVDQVTLVTRSDLVLTDRDINFAPLIRVRDKLELNGVTVEGKALAGKLTDAFAQNAAESRRFREPGATGVLLLIDASARWERVAEALAAARTAKASEVTFVFARPKTTPPPRTSVDDDLDKLKAGGNLATALSGYIRKKIAACPAMIEVMGKVADDNSGDRAGAMLASVGPALIACDCAVDPAEMKSLFWGFLGNPQPLGAIRVTLDPHGTRLDAPKQATWAEVQKQLLTSTTMIK